MTPGKPVTTNQKVELNNGLLVIPAGTTGTLVQGPNFIAGPDQAKVIVDFPPPIGRQDVPYLVVDGPPYIGDML